MTMPRPATLGTLELSLRPALLGLALVAGALGACGEDAPPPKPAAPLPPPPAELPEAPLESNPEEDADLAYVYSPIGKRDPFRSLFDINALSKGDSDIITELQTFELDQLKLVGIVSRIATPYALVEDPSRKGHTLTRGKLIGKNWGRVSQITPECVVIKEEYRDYTGRKVTNKTSMCVPKPEDIELQ